MDRARLTALYRAGSGLVVLGSIAVQVGANIAAGGFDPTRFFTYFTILSNLFGAVLFIVLAARWRRPRATSLDLLRGASSVYLTVTFIVVIWLLSRADLQIALPLVDFILHKLFPVVVVVDWLIDPPARRLTWRQGALWLAFPLAWVTFALARGATDGWYPYPFLDPANGGYGTVAFYFVAILIGFLGIAAATVWIGNVMGARRRAPLSHARPSPAPR